MSSLYRNQSGQFFSLWSGRVDNFFSSEDHWKIVLWTSTDSFNKEMCQLLISKKIIWSEGLHQTHSFWVRILKVDEWELAKTRLTLAHSQIVRYNFFSLVLTLALVYHNDCQYLIHVFIVWTITIHAANTTLCRKKSWYSFFSNT